jgi:anhydro-N-acetylmuramic acid kinase
MEKIGVIGLMSGTSLDGVDIACCHFSLDKKWNFEITRAETIPYSNEWSDRLRELPGASALQLALTNIEYGRYLGKLVYDFIRKYKLKVELISSHGHTVFHQPDKGITLQIGKGIEIFSQTSIPVVYDFRSQDVAFGGQGAPLVPVGDKLLFGEYDYCLNLGGIANISYEKNRKRIAFDICPCNQVLNELAKAEGLDYDRGGELARSGKIDPHLLDLMNVIPFYHQPPPKSLGREWVEEKFIPLIINSKLSIPDALATCSEHIAFQVGRMTGSDRRKKMLISGGGALNKYLVERIKAFSSPQIILPDKKLIHFKEAMVFAFLGLLRWRNEINCLSSVTGAIMDSSSGLIVGK